QFVLAPFNDCFPGLKTLINREKTRVFTFQQKKDGVAGELLVFFLITTIFFDSSAPLFFEPIQQFISINPAALESAATLALRLTQIINIEVERCGCAGLAVEI